MPLGIPFGEYRLIRRLGSGGMAEVFLAKRTGPRGFEKQLVIKRILPHLTTSEHFTQLFLKEARLAALIDHPNLVHVSNFGEIDGNYFLEMEYVDGATVADLQSILGTLTPGVVCRIGIDLLDALHAIHTARGKDGEALGLVHRDVTPRNVMLTRDGAVKLLDFGIAISKNEEAVGMMGTQRHMSPEQMRGEPLDARSDLFCAGVLLFQLMTGNAPFQTAPDTLPARPVPIPPELWTTIRSTLSIRPEDRPATARQIQASLEIYVASRGIEGTRAHVAELVSQVLPRDRASSLSALSRITHMTMTGIRRLTSPLSSSSAGLLSDGAVHVPHPLRARASWSLYVGAMLAVGIISGALTSLALRILRSRTAPIVSSLAEESEGGHDEVPAGKMPVDVAGSVGPSATTSIAGALRVPARDGGENGPPESGAERRGEKGGRPAKVRSGSLTIDTRPWTEVYLAGRKLGLTPMAGIKLPSGRHELELRNPTLGIVRKIQVTIHPGRVTRVQRVL